MKYKLTETIQRILLQKMIVDDVFFKKWSQVITSGHFKGESAERGKILQLILEHGKNNSPSFTMLEQIIMQERDRDIRKALADELEEVELVSKKLKPDELDVIAQQFIVNSKSLQAVEEQLKLIEEGRYFELGKPIEKLLREGIGTGIADDFFSLAFDGTGDSILSKRMHTGWRSLDRHSYGGIGEGELWLVMGQEFKTQICLHFCRAALMQGVGSYYVTLEVSKAVLAARMICLLTGCSLREAMQEELWVLEMLAKQQRAMKAPFVIREYPMHSIGVEQIKNNILLEEARRELRGDRRFKLIVVDYPDLLLAPKGGRARFSTTDIYAELKRWAQEDGRRVVVASQLTKEGQKATTRDRNSVAEDKTKIDNSDAVLSLNMTPEEQAERLLRLYTVKMRVGTPYREVLLEWRKKSFRFHEVD